MASGLAGKRVEIRRAEFAEKIFVLVLDSRDFGKLAEFQPFRWRVASI
jgi:hypothetical protein